MSKTLKKAHKIDTAIIALILFECFSLISMFYSIYLKDPQFVGLSIVTMAILTSPWLVEKMFHVRFSASMKILVLILASACTVLGHVWQMYYIVPLWDKIVHAIFGFLFAGFGFIIPQLANRRLNKNCSKAFGIICALMAVMAISVIWEYAEFACDNFFHMDLQHDFVVHRITSYKLGSALGEQGVINNITSVVVNGQELGLGGYLDVGLYDTMFDMLAATAGSIIFCILTVVKKGKLMKSLIPYVLPWKKEEYLEAVKKEKEEKVGNNA